MSVVQTPSPAWAFSAIFRAPTLYPMWEDARSWRSWLRATGASEGTIRLRTHYVDDFADQCDDPWSVTSDDVITYLGRPGWSPETRKSARSALRSFYAWALATGRVERDPTGAVPAIRVPSGVPKPTPEQVLARALGRADRQTRLMLMLAAYAGLRRAEIAGLHSDDVTELGLRVKGKGGRTRLIPIHARLADELEWVPSGWVFPSPVRDGPVSVDYVAARVTAVLDRGWTCHTLRHRFATQAYASTHDWRSVQALLGHSKPETTMRYVAVADEALAAAVDGII